MQGIYRFINSDISTVGCNLRCEYCYIKQHGDEDAVLKIDTDKKRFHYPVVHMLKALSIERMGGVCMFNISGSGETLLCPEIIEITEGLLRSGHYVALVSNCTVTDRVRQLAALPASYKERLTFKASFQYRELRKRNMLMDFAGNVNLLKAAGIAYSIEIISSDYFLDDIEEIKEFCMSNFGALPHLQISRDEYAAGTYPRSKTKLTPEEYNTTWASFDSDLFAYQQHDYDIPHREFCYAGVYTGSLSLCTGDFSPCSGTRKVTNFFEDLESQIRFLPVGHLCPFPNCFLGFVLHVLAGVARDYDPGVFFRQFRDRLCADGSHQLTPTIREVFSHRCSEYHEPYAPEKEFYIDLLMRKVYKGTDPSEEEMTKLALIIFMNLSAKGYKKAAIYGMGVLGQWLFNILTAAGIYIVCGIDRRFAEVKSTVPVQSPDIPVPSVDVVIVSVYAEFTNIAPSLRMKTDAVILSITELAG